MPYRIPWYTYNQAQPTPLQRQYYDFHPFESGTRDHHIHAFSGITSTEAGHTHEIVGTTEPASNEVGHTHQYVATTSFLNDHRHVIHGRTGPSIPLPNGGHFHYLEGVTSVYPSHNHRYQGSTVQYP